MSTILFENGRESTGKRNWSLLNINLQTKYAHCNCSFNIFFFFAQVRGLTDNNSLNYRSESDKDRNDTTEKSSTVGKNFFDRRDTDRDGDAETERDHRERRTDENITIQDFKELKERERDTSTTHTDHSSNKRRRKNSSNCDNSLISTYNTNIQERHYSQDSQVIEINGFIIERKTQAHIRSAITF